MVDFDAYAWLLTDPETEVGSAPLADVPCLPELPRLIRLKYLTSVNRWTRLETPVALLHASTGGHKERSLVWRDMLSRFGVTDVASLVFRCRYGCWGFLDLWRSGAAPSFTDDDAAFLSAIAKPVNEALRRCQADDFQPRRAGDGARRACGPHAVSGPGGDVADGRRRTSTCASWYPRAQTGGQSQPVPTTSRPSCCPWKPASTNIRQPLASICRPACGSHSVPHASAPRRRRTCRTLLSRSRRARRWSG